VLKLASRFGVPAFIQTGSAESFGYRVKTFATRALDTLLHEQSEVG
jgi:hypothetical protein